MPTSAYWDLARRATHCHVTSNIYFFSTGLTHAILDIVILVLPLIEVIKMHLPLGQKIAVMALFGFGSLVCVLTILVIQDAFKFKSASREVALKIGFHGSLAAAECNLTNVSGTFHRPNTIISINMLKFRYRCFDPSSARSYLHHSSPLTEASAQSSTQPYHQITASRAVVAQKPLYRTAPAQCVNL
ncbi:hypothetical protein IL306_007524 [Fusarium sp. DS 682]|nr:hypothetical protein IL306_007524 [Fusarium sp. DS 682]